MQDYSNYVSPFSARYASPQMQYLFSQRYRSIIWRQLWLILAESEKELGLNISDEQIAEMKANIENIDFDAISSYEKELRHDVMAHVYAFGDVAPKARPIIHLGATSCYVGDNADIIILRDALGILLKRLVDIAKNLAKFAHKYKAMQRLGPYTHFQPCTAYTVVREPAFGFRMF